MNIKSILKLGLVAVAGWLYYKNSNSNNEYKITFPSDNSGGGNGGDETPNPDPKTPDENAENPDIVVTGNVQVGVINYISGYNGWSRGKVSVKLRNKSTRAVYRIRRVEFELYILGQRVGWKRDMVKDIDKVLNPGKEQIVTFDNTPCILTDCRDELKELICTEAHKKLITSCSNVKIDDIAQITVTIDWLPGNGAGEEMHNRYVLKPCDLEYKNEAFYS